MSADQELATTGGASVAGAGILGIGLLIAGGIAWWKKIAMKSANKRSGE